MKLLVSSLLVFLSVAINAQVPANSLVLHYTFDDINNNIANDISGNNLDGVLVNEPLVVTGVSGTALQFNGIDNYLISYAPQILPEGSEHRTISMWVRVDQNNASAVFAGYGRGSRCQNFQIGTDYTSGEFLSFYGWNACDYVTDLSTITLADGNFHHLALVYDGLILSIYVDGALVSSVERDLNTVANTLCLAGEISSNACDRLFAGAIDDFRLYSRALSQSEIASIANFPTDSLALYYSFDEVNGVLVNDLSGNNQNGTLVNQPTQVVGVSGGALQFNGNDNYLIALSPTALPVGSESRTIGFWLSLDQHTTGAVFAGYGTSSRCKNFQIGTDYTNGETLAFYGWNACDYNSDVLVTELADGDFHHIAYSYDGSDLKIYLDGQLRNIAARELNTVANALCIAGEVSSGSCDRLFAGKIDEFRVYSRALNDTEIASLASVVSGTTNRLQVVSIGNGSVEGPGIDCNSNCDENYITGTSVELIAVPQEGYILDSWGLDCLEQTTNSCVVVLDADRIVEATFVLRPEPVYVNECAIVESNGFTHLSHFEFEWVVQGVGHTAGTYTNGDCWIQGPVIIESVSPAPYADSNGSMANPDANPSVGQGYESGLAVYDSSLRINYPYSASANTSIVSSITAPDFVGPTDNRYGWIVAHGVLTVTENVVSSDEFRPPYSVKNKENYRFSASLADFSHIPRVTPIGETIPEASTIIGQTVRPWVDHLFEFKSRGLHALNNMPGYGANVTSVMGAACLASTLNWPEQEHLQLAKNITQIGIDNFGLIEDGLYFPPNGGHMSGRLLPILYAGKALNHEGMLSVTSRPYPIEHGFAENCQTYGEGEYGVRYCNRGSTSTSYITVNSPTWVGQSLCARMIDVEDNWNHQPFFNYVRNYADSPEFGNTYGPYDSFHADMWLEYNSDY